MPAISEKKRKRHSERDDRPSKKVALNSASVSSPTTVNVSFLQDTAELCPVVASTPGLILPSNIPLKPYKKTISAVVPPGQKGPKNSYELLLQSSAHSRLDYTASEERDGTADSLLKHYVGVYDPRTGELKVMEARKLVVRSTLRSEIEELRQSQREAATAQRATMTSKRQELGMEFGTKKAKKAIASITENAISPLKAGAGDQLASALLDTIKESTSSMPTKEQLQVAVDETKPRPKPNLSAKAPAEVYTIEALIGSDTMKLLQVKDWIDAYQPGGEIPQFTVRYVPRRIQDLAVNKDVKKLKVLKYILSLMSFYNALKTRGREKRLPQTEELQERSGLSSAILDNIKRKFTDKGTITKWHTDFLMTHIAALALIIDNFETDINDLVLDLRLENKQVAQYFHEIGCKVAGPNEKQRSRYKIKKQEASQHKVAVLKLPLNLPKQRVAKRR